MIRLLSSSFCLLSTRRKAQAVLALVLLIGGIIVIIGLALAFFATSFVNSAYGFIAAQRAETVAASGVYDALLRLDRNKDLSGSVTVILDGNPASVTVTQDSPSSGLVAISSAATISNHTRTINAVVSRSSSTGETRLVSWTLQ